MKIEITACNGGIRDIAQILGAIIGKVRSRVSEPFILAEFTEGGDLMFRCGNG
jgi:hypothetical protein